MNRKRIYLALFALLLVAVACKDSQLRTISNALNDTAKSMAVVHTTILAANTNHFISDADTTKFMYLEIQINQAGKDAVEATKGVASLSVNDKASIAKILQPVLVALNNAVNAGTAGITDPKIKQDVQLLLIAIQTSLNTVELIVSK